MEIQSCAINAYLHVMNTIKHRNKMLRALTPKKTAVFLGSWVMFEPSEETYLRKACVMEDGTPSTDAKSKDTVIREIHEARASIKKRQPLHVWFTLCVVTSESTSHTAAYVFNRKSTEIKVLNSAISPLANYQYNNVLDETAMEACGCNILYTSSLCNGENPQDICRGGLLDIAKSYITSYGALHNDGFCQTWSVLMMMNEFVHMNKPDYEIGENYLEGIVSTNLELKRVIREFIIWIVAKWPTHFEREFSGLIRKLSSDKVSIIRNCSHIEVLLATFQTLHSEIRVVREWNENLYK